MALTLALTEGFLLFAVGSSMIVFWKHADISTWLNLAALILKGLALSFCCVVSFYYNDLYDLRIVRNFREFASRLLQSFGVAFILLAGFYTIFPRANIAGGPFVSSLLIIAGLLLPLRAISYAVMRSRPFTERVLVVGVTPFAQTLLEQIEAQPHWRYTIVGLVSDGASTPTPTPRYPLLGSLEDLRRIIADAQPDRILIALSDRRGRMPLRELLEARSRRILIEDGVEVYERLMGKLAIESLGPSSLIFSKDFLKSRLDVALGRAVSLVVSVVGLVGLAPLLTLIGLAIKLDSSGPMLFVQDRVGMNGKPFRLLKFRTMHHVKGCVSEWAHDNSHRITRVGKWLRKFRLDELPQFVNIIRGDMNLVGPRPHPVSNFRLFLDSIPYYTLRSVVRPGVTGWAQIRYRYANNLEEETEKMRYDLYYIKHLSIWFDLRILFDTIKTVLFDRPSVAAHRQSSLAPDNGNAPSPPDVALPLDPQRVGSHRPRAIQPTMGPLR